MPAWLLKRVPTLKKKQQRSLLMRRLKPAKLSVKPMSVRKALPKKSKPKPKLKLPRRAKLRLLKPKLNALVFSVTCVARWLLCPSAATQKLIGDALDEKRQHALLDEFFSGVKSGKVVVLDDASFKGESAEVTSALPLTDTEQDSVKKDVLAKVGAQAVTFRVDPSILGGLVIKVGDKVMDGSVAGKLDGLRQNLK